VLKVKSSKEFTGDIENIAKESGMSYIECIVQYCEEKDLDIESVSNLVGPLLKEKIQYEAENLHMIPKTATKLPL
jgi:hypothetical protein|tara:strand:- start:1706 stop:1930 length:225 start_codon:yes stop_codon:yes gene_type:complete